MTEQLYRRHPNAVTYGAIDPETGAMLMWVMPVVEPLLTAAEWRANIDYEAAEDEYHISHGTPREIVDAAVKGDT